MVIKDCILKDGKFINHGKVGFIDFGVSESFINKNNFLCKKYVGKTVYKSPKVYSHTPFDARKADIWSLGVVLFMLQFGCQPYTIPHNNCQLFCLITKGKIIKYLKEIDKYKYVTKPLISMLIY